MGSGFLKAVTSAAKFQQSLSVLQVTTGATREEMAALAKEAKDLGADITLPAVTAQSAADAMTELAKAGLSVQDSLQGARGVLQLSTAAAIGSAQAAQIVASSLNAFGLGGSQAVRVADDLANAANAAQGSITDFAIAMQQVAAVAHQAGFSLEDTTSLLTILAKAGLQSSDAGTSLRTAITRLIAPTAQANKIIEGLGISIRDAQGKFRPDVFAQFRQATEGLGPAARDAAAAIVFGQDAIRAASIAGAAGARGLKETELQIEAQGTAAELAQARTTGLAGSVQGLQSASQTLGVTLGGLASGPIKTTVDALSNLVSELNSLATLDFHTLGQQLGSDFDSLTRKAEQTGKGFADLSHGLSSTNLGEISKGLKEIFSPAPAGQDRVTQLREALLALQNLRVKAFDVGIPIGPITAQIQSIRKQLRDAKVDAGELIPVTPLEKALAPLRSALHDALSIQDEIRKAGGSNAAIDSLIQNLQTRIKVKIQAFHTDLATIPKLTAEQITKDINTVLTTLAADPTGPFAEKLLQQLKALITKLKDQGKLTAGEGNEIGKRLMEAFGEGITANEQVAIDAARRALTDVRRQGDEQVRQAIQGARANLESLGSQLSQQQGSIIDILPSPPAVRRQVQAVSREVERGLRFNLSGARADLATAQRAAASVGTMTPAQRAAQAEWISGLRARVADAKEALKTFKTDDAVSEIDKLKERLQELQDVVQKQHLRFDLTSAKRDLRDAQAAIQHVGTLTPQQKREQQQFLEPLKQRVQDAKASLAEFKLDHAISQQEKLQAAAKKAADDGIAKLVDEFQRGKISAGQFDKLLEKQLGPSLDALKTRAGKNLGFVFTRDFLREVSALKQQVDALAPFLGRPGTAPGPTVVRPATTVADVARSIDDSKRALQTAIQNATKQNSAENGTIETLLRQIRTALKGTPSNKGKNP